MRFSLFISLIVLVFFASWTIAADKIVFIGATVPLGAADAAVKTHLTALGFTVEDHAQTEKQPVDITGAAAVFIFESVTSSNITSAYKNAAIPVIMTEPAILDDMKFAPDGTFDSPAGQVVTIVDPSHPIAGGLKGDVKVATANGAIAACSGFKVDCVVVAKSAVNGSPCIVTFEKGIKDMDGNPIPARRVYTFIEADLALAVTNDGWALFERSVLWALGKLTSAAVDPDQKLSLTWGEVKAAK